VEVSDMSDNLKKTKVYEYMHADIASIPVEATLKEASQAFTEKGVGALLVKEGQDYIGIISETRLSREGIAKGLNVETTSVRSIMRADLITVEFDQSVNETREIMKANGVRHLVVKEKDKIVGIITLSDLIRYYADFFEE
jgi:predicted transcriptional regulator